MGYVHWDHGESEDLDVVGAACAGELSRPGGRSEERMGGREVEACSGFGAKADSRAGQDILV